MVCHQEMIVILKNFMELYGMIQKNLFYQQLKKPIKYNNLRPFTNARSYKTNREKGRDKRFFKNWRPISLLMQTQNLSERMKNVLRCIIYKSQTTYINKRIISEGGRLTDKFLEICDMYNEEGFLVTVSIERFSTQLIMTS